MYLKNKYLLDVIMVIFSFKDIKFEDGGDNIRCVFLKYFEFGLQKKDLDSIGFFHVEDQDLVFPDVSEKKASKFNFLLSDRFSRLKSMITNNPTTYIHQNSGIPLITAKIVKGGRILPIQEFIAEKVPNPILFKLD